MKVVVTGGCGFVGSNLVAKLKTDGHAVEVIDRRAARDIDLNRDRYLVEHALEGADAVVHLAANADVRGGWNNPSKDLNDNVVASLNLFEAMRKKGVKRLIFASSGAVYGDARIRPTPETEPLLKQTSLYGASKAAVEGFLGAYAEAKHLSVTIFRCVSMLGPGYTHGHVIDFVRKLQADPSMLGILGNGKQLKSYLDVHDAVRAMSGRLDKDPGFEVYNLGYPDAVTITESARWISEAMGLDPKFVYTGENWVGDHTVLLDVSKLMHTGWEPTITIAESLARTVDAVK